MLPVPLYRPPTTTVMVIEGFPKENKPFPFPRFDGKWAFSVFGRSCTVLSKRVLTLTIFSIETVGRQLLPAPGSGITDQACQFSTPRLRRVLKNEKFRRITISDTYVSKHFFST